MTIQHDWNERAREELRETLRSFIRGEMRLAKRNREEILQGCGEVFLDDACPENERDTFVAFAADELERAQSQLVAEQATWPQRTDCDRLDRVQGALLRRGILLWQASPCCDTCTVGELSDRIDEIDRHYPGFRKRVRGYSFFIDQNLPETLAESTQTSVYLGYGWISQDESEVAPEEYEQRALGIAREVCECLHDEGFRTDWDGDFARKIGLSLNWQRRTRLE